MAANPWHWYAQAPLAEGLDWAKADVRAGLASDRYRPSAAHRSLADIGKERIDASAAVGGRRVEFAAGEFTLHAAELRFDGPLTGKVRVPFLHVGDRLVAYCVLDGVQEVYEGAFSMGVPSAGILRLAVDMGAKN